MLPFYAGSVKCIFIDPPYNTGSAFSHYDDNLEHSLWLNMMYPRLELLRELLAEDGSIWITLDDNESHYCKIMCDEIFGRNNFVANVVWEKSDSPKMDAQFFSTRHDHILCYAKNMDKTQWNKLEITEVAAHYDKVDEQGRKYYLKPLRAMSGQADTREARPTLYFPLTAPDGTEIYPKRQDGSDGRWRWGLKKINSEKDRIDWIKGKNGWTPYYRIYADSSAFRPPETLWRHEEVGTNRTSRLEIKNLVQDITQFDTPKPERLIQRILQIATNQGDLVLDSFLGSGTTAAVAHKMNRRYIGIEIGEHAKTHVVPRLQKVIDGEQGGVSGSLNWQGGGAFRFCELGVPVFDEYGSLNPEIKFVDLAAYIWFLQTKTPFAFSGSLKPSTPLIGEYENTVYYLLYNGILGDKRPQFGNVLTAKILADLPHLADFVAQGKTLVVYGEACRVGDETLRQNRMVFKQIPYHVTDK